MRPILKSPRVLRTGQPLTLEGIRQACPAVFAEGPHESRGPRYLYVPTIRPLEALLANGWGVYEASQQRSKSLDKDPYAKHMLRMRKLSDFEFDKVSLADGVPEVIFINAHDGTAKYHLLAGYFRFVCSNGLISGRKMAGFSIQHTINSKTSDEILTAGERVVTESFPTMMGRITRFKAIHLNTEKQYQLAEKALNLRYPSVAVRPFPASDLLAVRREEDREPTLWNILNRVQEGAVYGGWETRSSGFNRSSMVRPVERVSAVTSINEGIWDEAEAIAKEMEDA
jgi:hypothetical protein